MDALKSQFSKLFGKPASGEEVVDLLGYQPLGVDVLLQNEAVDVENKVVDDPSKFHASKRPLFYVLTVLTVFIFFVTVSIIPIADKVVFQGLKNGASSPFEYPLWVTVIQLVPIVVVLVVWSVFQHFFVDKGATQTLVFVDEEMVEHEVHVPRSWFFGPHFLFKCKHTALVGIFFGLKLGLTKWGLQVAPLNMHLLIDSLSIFWTYLFAFIWLRERPTLWELIACAGCIAGSILISVDLSQSLASPFVPVMINLLATVLLGLTVVALRHACRILCPNLGRNKGPVSIVGEMSFMELTCFKLMFSAATVLPCALLYEGFIKTPSVWGEFGDMTYVTWLLIFLGAAVTLVYQSNYVVLQALTMAGTTGVLSTMKIMSQLAGAEIAVKFLSSYTKLKTFNPTPIALIGLIIIIASSVMFALIKIVLHVREARNKGKHWFVRI
mmetsp:Transcript_12851/g.32769  ORF Transcript_12851/g.32769 Transcript_12851/m.32769 type:complete len:439 (+) Transcript_12851:257-1573(+)